MEKTIYLVYKVGPCPTTILYPCSLDSTPPHRDFFQCAASVVRERNAKILSYVVTYLLDPRAQVEEGFVEAVRPAVHNEALNRKLLEEDQTVHLGA